MSTLYRYALRLGLLRNYLLFVSRFSQTTLPSGPKYEHNGIITKIKKETCLNTHIQRGEMKKMKEIREEYAYDGG